MTTNTTTLQTPLFTDLNQADTSTLQGGYYACHRPRRYYVPVCCYRPCCSGGASATSVVQTVNVNVVD